MSELAPRQRASALVETGLQLVPAIVADEGKKASKRFLEFFTATIRNGNTRVAYARAVGKFFAWCEERGFSLLTIEPMVVAAYIEELGQSAAKSTVKQSLAAIRHLFDWLVTGQILPMNPAHAVKGPKHVVTRGKTPVLSAEQARKLLDSIDTSTFIGLRDRAIIGVMVFSFARVGAVVAMTIDDYYQDGKRCWFRLHEKGGKENPVPAHHTAEAYLDEYLESLGQAHRSEPLFRTVDRRRLPTNKPLTRTDALRMIKRRAKKAELPESTCCHTFRATGITTYLDNGGTIENAQNIAGHASPRTTKLYDRTSDAVTLDEVERIRI